MGEIFLTLGFLKNFGAEGAGKFFEGIFVKPLKEKVYLFGQFSRFSRFFRVFRVFARVDITDHMQQTLQGCCNIVHPCALFACMLHQVAFFCIIGKKNSKCEGFSLEVAFFSVF